MLPTSPKVPAALQPGVPRNLLSVGQSSRNRAAVPAFYSLKVSFKISVIGDFSHSLRSTSFVVAVFSVLSGPCLLMYLRSFNSLVEAACHSPKADPCPEGLIMQSFIEVDHYSKNK